eukprot:404144-Amphidinium_carterae.1
MSNLPRKLNGSRPGPRPGSSPPPGAAAMHSCFRLRAHVSFSSFHPSKRGPRCPPPIGKPLPSSSS